MCGSSLVSSPYSKVARPTAAQLSSRTPRYPLAAFNAQRRAERASAKIGDELLDHVPKGTLLLRCQAPPVAPERREDVIRRHLTSLIARQARLGTPRRCCSDPRGRPQVRPPPHAPPPAIPASRTMPGRGRRDP